MSANYEGMLINWPIGSDGYLLREKPQRAAEIVMRTRTAIEAALPGAVVAVAMVDGDSYGRAVVALPGAAWTVVEIGDAFGDAAHAASGVEADMLVEAIQ